MRENKCSIYAGSVSWSLLLMNNKGVSFFLCGRNFGGYSSLNIVQKAKLYILKKYHCLAKPLWALLCHFLLTVIQESLWISSKWFYFHFILFTLINLWVKKSLMSDKTWQARGSIHSKLHGGAQVELIWTFCWQQMVNKVALAPPTSALKKTHTPVNHQETVLCWQCSFLLPLILSHHRATAHWAPSRAHCLPWPCLVPRHSTSTLTSIRSERFKLSGLQ